MDREAPTIPTPSLFLVELLAAPLPLPLLPLPEGAAEPAAAVAEEMRLEHELAALAETTVPLPPKLHASALDPWDL